MGKFIPVEPEKWAEMVKALALVVEMDKTINASQAECRRLKEKSECQAECLEAFDKKLREAEAKVERLTAEVSYDNRVQLHVDKLAAEFTQYEVERLKAEVERLRKAGDELEVAFQAYTYGWPYEPLVISKAIHRWKAAKEGKQS